MSDVREEFLGLGDVRLAVRTAGPRGAPPLVLLPALGETGRTGRASCPPSRNATACTRSTCAGTAGVRGRGRAPTVWSRCATTCCARWTPSGSGGPTSSATRWAAWSPACVHCTGPCGCGGSSWRTSAHRLPREPSTPERPEGEWDFDGDMVLEARAQIDRPDPAWASGLARITARTLVIGGGPDSHVPQDRVAELARRVPDARLITIAAGHPVHRAEPGRFTREVLAFLDG